MFGKRKRAGRGKDKRKHIYSIESEDSSTESVPSKKQSIESIPGALETHKKKTSLLKPTMEAPSRPTSGSGRSEVSGVGSVRAPSSVNENPQPWTIDFDDMDSSDLDCESFMSVATLIDSRNVVMAVGVSPNELPRVPRALMIERYFSPKYTKAARISLFSKIKSSQVETFHNPRIYN